MGQLTSTGPSAPTRPPRCSRSRGRGELVYNCMTRYECGTTEDVIRSARILQFAPGRHPPHTVLLNKPAWARGSTPKTHGQGRRVGITWGTKRVGSKNRVLGSEVGRPGGTDQGVGCPCSGISRFRSMPLRSSRRNPGRTGTTGCCPGFPGSTPLKPGSQDQAAENPQKSAKQDLPKSSDADRDRVHRINTRETRLGSRASLPVLRAAP